MGYERDYTPIPPPLPAWRQRLRLYWKLVRGDRPIGWLLLLWPTWWGLWLAAGGMPPLGPLVVFTLGVWLTRSAGCVINDYADRWLDPQVERTKQRPLATGAVSGREALGVFVVLMLVAFALVLTLNRLTVWLMRSAGCVVNDYADRWLDGSVERTRGRPLATGAVSGREALLVFATLLLAAFALVLTLDRLTVGLSIIGVLLAMSYPYLKRYTYLPQVYLGMAFGWGIPMAFAAIQGRVPAIAWVLYVANIFWATAYDTWYAMVDRDDDLRMGAKSTAILFGDMDLVAQAVLYALMFAALALVGRQAQLGSFYWYGLGVAALLVLYEFALARHRGRDACFKAFLHNHWVGAAIFAGIALALWKPAA